MASLRKRLKTKEFQRLFAAGVFIPGKQLSILIRKSNASEGKFGVTLKKKKRNSVQRNFMKRRLRVAFFLAQQKIPLDYDIVLIGNDTASTSPLDKLCDELLSLVRRAENKGVL